jgi:WhiB family redox-sensing transcriptional regulator
MTDTNLNKTPGQPNDSNSRVDRDTLDFIDETAAQITNAEIEERLRETLRRAGHCTPPSPSSGPDISPINTCPDDALDLIDGSYKMGSQMLAELAQVELGRAELAAALVETARIQAVASETVEAAREEADKALRQAADIIRQAKLQAEQIVSAAKLEGEKIVADARQAADEQMAAVARPATEKSTAAEPIVGAAEDVRQAIAPAVPSAVFQPPQLLFTPLPFLPTTASETTLTLFGQADMPTGLDLPCTDDPELFFADAPEDVEAAKTLCQGCRARAACLEGALERREAWGVWGGELLLRGVIVPGRIPNRGMGQPQAEEKDARVESRMLLVAKYAV